MGEYFTKEQMLAVEKALARIATVGVDVVTHSDADRQRRVFFNKARLWGVVKQIISVLYIDG
ncbi:MAG: hypothetical protein Q7J27_00545, partial [Syntrophales bacterium]|nr:hypothetical protein [Syntrophales bacterium]